MRNTINYTHFEENYWKAGQGDLEKYILSDAKDYLEVLKKAETYLMSTDCDGTDIVEHLQGTSIWEELWLAAYKQASRIVNATWNHATRTSFMNYASSGDAISEITMHLLDEKRLRALLDCKAASCTVNAVKDPNGRLSLSNTVATNKFKDMNEKVVRKQTPPLAALDENGQKVKSKYRASNPLINLDELSNPESTYYDASALTDRSVNILDDMVTTETSDYFMKLLCKNTNVISFFLFTCRHYFGYDTNKLLDALNSDTKTQLFEAFNHYCLSVLECDLDTSALYSFDFAGITAKKVYHRVNQVMTEVQNYSVNLNTIFSKTDLKDFFLYVAIEVLGYNKRELISALNSYQKDSIFEEFYTYCSFAIKHTLNTKELHSYTWDSLDVSSIKTGVSKVEVLLKSLKK